MLYEKKMSGADGGKWMRPIARSRRDIYNEHVKSEKGCKIGLDTSKVCMSLRNEHFQNAARGPLKYVGPGPSAPHFEIVHFEKTKEGGDPPPSTYMFVLGNTCKPDLAYTSSQFPREIVNPCCLCCRFLLI